MLNRFLHLKTIDKVTKEILYKPKKKHIYYEDAIKLAFIQWIEYQPKIKKYLIGIEHEGCKNKLLAARHQRLGLTAGISDYLLFYNNGKYPCMWLEFKVGKNTLSPKQKVFKELAESQGHKYITVWSAEEGIAEVINYMNGGHLNLLSPSLQSKKQNSQV